MKRMATTVVLTFALSAFAAEKVDEHEHEHGHEHEHEHEHEHGHDRGAWVEVGAAAVQAMGLRTVHPEKRRMRSTVALLGRLELAPDARMSAATPVAGRVSIKVSSLESVTAGAVLFTVEAPELRAKTKEIALLEQRLKVYRDLNRVPAERESELALKRAEREAMLAGAEERDGVVSVRATASGRVESLPVSDGSWVSSGTTVVELQRSDRVRFAASVASSDAGRLRDGMKAACGGRVGTLQVGFGGADGVTPVYAVFDRELPFRPGERMQLNCVTDESETPVVAVPSACIVRVGLDPTVFVRDEHDADRFLAVKVEPGRTNGGWTEVKGLPDDDLEIVKEGAYELKIALAAQSGSAPAGHFHADGTFHEGGDEH
ncbi:MAG: efflux RND transporter periplasmic adaptor subunit [Kiritimatiellae bacterium]|nr:efflux RND transporter periplasmic adaptor subunit [Kiritimatiellia bacterium]